MSRLEPSEVLDLARQGGLTLGSAESLTGGAVSAAMTAVAGASDVWGGAIVAYSAAVKRDLLAVPASVLEQVGAVSADTALAMAHGARRQLGVDFAVSTTGVAGPLSHAGRDVGVVFIGITGPGVARSQEFAFTGDRAQIVDSAREAAIEALFSALGGHARATPGTREQP